jgi:hypothetical protein
MFSFDRKSPIEMRDCGNNLNLVENEENIFSSYSLPEVTGPLVSSLNRKSVSLQLTKFVRSADPRQCGYLRICDLWAHF